MEKQTTIKLVDLKPESYLDTKLVQFQCGREGTLFYYQHAEQSARAMVSHCPICGSSRVSPTGRTFKPVNENFPMK